MNGRLLAIFLRPAARLPVRAMGHALAIAGQGLHGDHAVGGRRQVTLLSQPAWARACREVGIAVDPAARRANLLVDVELASCIGQALRIGDVVIDVLGETRPCELLDDHGRQGLCAALRIEGRGGVYGTIRTGGELRIGAACGLVSRAAALPPAGHGNGR